MSSLITDAQGNREIGTQRRLLLLFAQYLVAIILNDKSKKINKSKKGKNTRPQAGK